MIIWGVFLAVLSIYYSGCGLKDGNVVKKVSGKTVNQTSALSWYNVEDSAAKYIELNDNLKNISGLCFTDDGRLFCEVDDSSGISQLDTSSGKILKTFFVGTGYKNHPDRIKSSFEDLSIVGNRFFIMNSHGKLYESKEGNEGEYVQYTIYKTKLNSDNNVEGLCYDPETNALLMACKDYPGEGFEKSRAIYTFSLLTMTMSDTPRFVIPTGKMKRNTIDGEFRPSGIALQSISGTFFVLASHGHTIVEISKEGDIINQKDLPEEIHPQPEGITFSKDNTLYISDEGKAEHPRLTVYKRHQ